MSDFFQNIDFRKIFFFPLAIVVTFLTLNSATDASSIFTTLLFLYVGLTSLYGIFFSIDQLPYSLNKTYNIFTLFFFSVAAALQYHNKISFLQAPPLNENDYLKAIITVAIAHTLYLVSYHLLTKNTFFSIQLKKNHWNLKSVTLYRVLLVLSVLSFFVFLILVKFDLDVVFKRPANHWQKNNTRFGLIGYSLLLVVRTIPPICLISYKLIAKNTKITNYLFLFVVTILAAFPFSLGRGTLVFYYLPIIILFIPWFKHKFIYSLSFIFGVLFMFPILNYFRPHGTIDLGMKQFYTPHFDAFHNLSHLLKENVITYGEQLLGGFLFFIPNHMWENKPVGTGQLIAEKLNFSYTNISMPFLGEGYANFGYLGVFFVVLFLAVLNSFFDKSYLKFKSNYGFRVVFLFLLGFEFYLLRGDLYSSIKFTVSYLLALFIVYVTLKLSQSPN